LDNDQLSLFDLRISQITYFPKLDNPEELIDYFDDPRPRNIKKALKNQIFVKKTKDNEYLDFLYRTHFENINSKGGNYKTREFFFSIPQFLKDNEWDLYVAFHSDKPISALLIFLFNKTVEYYTPAIDDQFKNLQPLSLIIYTSMIELYEKGFKMWNWGGTHLDQQGVFNFKKKWYSKNTFYYYFIKIFNPKVFEIGKEELMREYKGFYLYPFNPYKKDEILEKFNLSFL